MINPNCEAEAQNQKVWFVERHELIDSFLTQKEAYDLCHKLNENNQDDCVYTVSSNQNEKRTLEQYG